MFSQSDALSLVHAHAHELEHVLSVRIEDAIGPSNVVSVHEHQTLIDALRMMIQHGELRVCECKNTGGK